MREVTEEGGETPVVLIVNDEEWTSRSLQSILQPNGYAVLLAYTGKQGLHLARKVRPDIFMVGLDLPDVAGEDLVDQLVQLPNVRPSSPVILFTSGSVNRRRRLSALRSGAWHLLRPPFDPDELLLRMKTYSRAKQDVDRAMESTFVDPATGFYNIQGLIRRATEITADASRNARPVACVVLGAGNGSESADTNGRILNELSARLAAILEATTRLSDSIGRIGESEFAILAPGTDDSGANRLAERLLEAVDSSDEPTPELTDRMRRVKAGFDAVTDTRNRHILPEDLLRNATSALRHVQEVGNGVRTWRFEEGTA